MSIDSIALARDWPGKKSESKEHPAIWHMLDVASCAEVLIQGHRAFTEHSESECQAFVVLAALHDIGKISASFRSLIRNNRRSEYRHWMLSDLLLTEVLDPIIEEAFGGERHARSELYAAVSGHHGGPERASGRKEIYRRRQCIGRDAELAAKVWLTHLLELFPGGSLKDLTQQAARQISWTLSGLTVASDWVASNVDWFPPAPSDLNLNDYHARSRKQAKIAIIKAGLDHAAISDKRSACALTGLTVLHPMQRAVDSIPLPDGPVLVLIEDATGSGKTESALIMAHRMICSGRARGLFFALPTMATANAMFDRLVNSVSNLFNDSVPTVGLSHGQASLNPRFRELIGSNDDSTPEAGCTRWLTDDRRRTMLSEVGVGTIDQALMGILPTRFSTLRLFGLTDRVLVVDEAHAYDIYMQRQLETLLHMQAMNGGSAIIMTATLPLSMRNAYVNAFKDGLGHESEELLTEAYPSLGIVGAKVNVQPIDPVAATCRTISVRRIESCESAIEYLIERASAGAACVWVRNSVDEAISAVDLLRSRGCSAKILHARFAYGDRLHNEQSMIDRFGRDGISREGQVLVATQVVEASLDLDFDVMVSDLAPIGSLIQRAGRLWRHMEKRPLQNRPVDGPVLNILSPDPNLVEDHRWLHDTLGRGAYVYRDDYQWRTARIIFKNGVIEMPAGLRNLIEAVHGRHCEELPETLELKLQEAEGAAFAESAQAQLNVVVPKDGYLNMGIRGPVWSEEKFPTRLGQEDATLVLAKHGSAGLIPWCEADAPARAWMLSEVRCNRHRLTDELPDQSAEMIVRIKEKWPKGKRENLILCPVSGSGKISDKLQYDSQMGLMFV